MGSGVSLALCPPNQSISPQAFAVGKSAAAWQEPFLYGRASARIIHETVFDLFVSEHIVCM